MVNAQEVESEIESTTRVEVARTNRIDNGIIVQNVDDAIDYLYNSGLTRFSSRDEFMYNQWLRRDEAAAFFVRFVRDVLNGDLDGDWFMDVIDDSDNDTIPTDDEQCQFFDLDQAHTDLVDEIKESCRLGLFKGHAWKFMPTDEFSNAHAMTVLIRLIEWMQNEPEDNWAREYFSRAKRAWLVQSLSASQEENLYKPITRGDVAKMIEWSAVYIASRSNERCSTVDPLDPDDDGDGILTSDERCVIEWSLVRMQAQDYNSSRSNKPRTEGNICNNGDEDCDDSDADRFPWQIDDCDNCDDLDSEYLSWLMDSDKVEATIWGRIDKASPYIMTEVAMPCDWVTCPDWSCAATQDECVWYIDDSNIIFVTPWADELYCRGKNWESETCPRERNQAWAIKIVKERSLTEEFKEYLTHTLTQRLQLPWVSDVVYSYSEWRVVWANWEIQIVVIVEPSERLLEVQANADVESDDIESVTACVTSSWDGDCPETKTCPDWSTVDCTCNTGICLCKMCSLSSTLETK